MMKSFATTQEMIAYLSEEYHIIKKDAKLQEHIEEASRTFEKETQRKLFLTDPFYENKKALERAKRDLHKREGIDIESDLKNYMALEKIASCKIEKDFWHQEIAKLKNRFKKWKEEKGSRKSRESIRKDALVTRRLLQEKWQKTVDEEYAKWELQMLQKYREEFMQKIEEWLALLERLYEVTSLTGGLFFDFSKDNISLQDKEEIKKWAEYIGKNKGVQELLAMLGKLRKSEANIKKELVHSVSYMKEQVVDIDSKEEIVGITIGRDLAHALPQELALLSDAETSLLFDMKYIDGRIMSFDMQGMSEKVKEHLDEKLIEVGEEDKKGPIIICVDTSGSMQGIPETIAKAITLYMAIKAKAEKRACYLINFSTGIESMELTENAGMHKLVQFLQRSFHGGTDASPALSHAVSMLQKEAYTKADVLMISDFVMGKISQETQDMILKAKEQKNRFYSLAIGNLFLHKQLKTIFDNEWVYNHNNGNIESIVKNLNTMESIA